MAGLQAGVGTGGVWRRGDPACALRTHLAARYRPVQQVSPAVSYQDILQPLLIHTFIYFAYFTHLFTIRFLCYQKKYI